MSSNDLYCDKCKSNHHPVSCPKDIEVNYDLVEAIKTIIQILSNDQINDIENYCYNLQRERS